MFPFRSLVGNEVDATVEAPSVEFNSDRELVLVARVTALELEKATLSRALSQVVLPDEELLIALVFEAR